MSCPLQSDRSAELIIGYSARTLDPETAADFDRHLERCGECSEGVALQMAVWAALDDAEWSRLQVSPDFDRRLFQRIEEAENRGWWPRRALIPMAACAGLIAALLLLQPDPVRAPEVQAQPALQIEQVEHALDDMELLSQFGSALAADPAGSQKRM